MPLSRLHYTPHVERFISQNAWVMTSYNSWHIPLCHPEAFWESHLGTLCSWTAHSCGLGIFPGKGRWNAAAVRRRSPDSLLWLLRLSAPELLGGGKTPVHRFRVSELVPVGQERRGRSPGQPLRPQRKSPPPRGCHPLKNPRVAPQRARSQRNGPQDREAPLPGCPSKGKKRKKSLNRVSHIFTTEGISVVSGLCMTSTQCRGFLEESDKLGVHQKEPEGGPCSGCHLLGTATESQERKTGTLSKQGY
ncbi:uncharacterized protein LOC103092175 isoform X7 [Monodelphis domestica]|uniref:uncharacterized protein LOC103092175 isoform X7 n=1 Tax=Monodelphis domestica TaxID=13616 RepID=UPI0024E249EF|nr:uncharacterized protein LOC103092175 isoform X7 [Monodelphis domestica]